MHTQHYHPRRCHRFAALNAVVKIADEIQNARERWILTWQSTISAAAQGSQARRCGEAELADWSRSKKNPLAAVPRVCKACISSMCFNLMHLKSQKKHHFNCHKNKIQRQLSGGYVPARTPHSNERERIHVCIQPVPLGAFRTEAFVWTRHCW